jgi:hypothetical protein
VDPLSEQDRERLAKLLGLLSSDHAGERASAGLMAWKFIKSRDLTWFEVLQPVLPVAAERPSGPTSGNWRQVVAHCQRYGADLGLLTTWEEDFLASLAGRRFAPTAKQLAVLNKIQLKVGRSSW